MAAVLTDVHIMEAAMNLNISNEIKTGNENMEATVLEVLRKNQVTKEQYTESFNFYSEHPQLLSEVYKLILNNLSELQAKTYSEKDSTVLKDSAKNAIADSMKNTIKRMNAVNKAAKLKLAKPKP